MAEVQLEIPARVDELALVGPAASGSAGAADGDRALIEVVVADGERALIEVVVADGGRRG